MHDTDAARGRRLALSRRGTCPVQEVVPVDVLARHSPARRVAVFVAGLVCIAAGIVLVALPGPLTIPPIILGLWLWSTEFEWAHRLLEPMKEKGREAWQHAKRHPVSSTLITVGGFVAAAAVFWAVQHFDLVDRFVELFSG